MKICSILAALLFAGLCASCRPGALMPHKEVWNVDCDLQVVSLPEDLAAPLVPELRDAQRSEGAFKEVQKLIAQKRATLVGWPLLMTQSGQRAVIEQIDELRYATEYRPAGIGVKPNQSPVQPTGTGTKAIVDHSDSAPTAFETRNVGVTFEIEPVVAIDGEIIEVNMVPQHVQFLEWQKVTIEKDPPAAKFIVEQPRFLTNKVATSITFHNGERKLIGIFKAEEPAGNVELFILRVDAMKRKVAVEKLPPPVAPPSAPAPPKPAGP